MTCLPRKRQFAKQLLPQAPGLGVLGMSDPGGNPLLHARQAYQPLPVIVGQALEVALCLRLMCDTIRIVV